MKKQILNIFTVVALCAAIVSCKKAKEADTSMVKAVAVSESKAGEYEVNLDESVIEWKGFKPTGTHNGTIKLESGVFQMSDDNLKGGTFLINMKSITSVDLEGDMKANLEAHLKGTVEGKEGDFFNVNKFSTGAFEITNTQEGKGGKIMLSGNLELKGIKHNVTFPVNISTEGDRVAIVSDAFTIDRTKWEINYGSKSVFDNLGDKFINDDIELKISIVANK